LIPGDYFRGFFVEWKERGKDRKKKRINAEFAESTEDAEEEKKRKQRERHTGGGRSGGGSRTR
jgi:hypothetical protein